MKSLCLLLLFVLASTQAFEWNFEPLEAIEELRPHPDKNKEYINKELLKEVYQRYVAVQKLEKKAKEAVEKKELKQLRETLLESRAEDAKIKQLKKKLEAEKEKSKQKKQYEGVMKFVNNLGERVEKIRKTLDKEYSEQSRLRFRPLVAEFLAVNKKVKELREQTDEAIKKKDAAAKQQLLKETDLVLVQIDEVIAKLEKEKNEFNRFRKSIEKLQERSEGLKIKVKVMQEQLKQKEEEDKDKDKPNQNFNTWARETQIKLTRIDNNLNRLEAEGQDAITKKDNEKKKVVREETQKDLDETRNIRREVVANQDRDDITDENRRWLRGTLTWIDRLTPRQEALIKKLQEEDKQDDKPKPNFNKWAQETLIELSAIDDRLRRLENEGEEAVLKKDAQKKKEIKETVEKDLVAVKRRRVEVEAAKTRDDITDQNRQWLQGTTNWISRLVAAQKKLIQKMSQ